MGNDPKANTCGPALHDFRGNGVLDQSIQHIEDDSNVEAESEDRSSKAQETTSFDNISGGSSAEQLMPWQSLHVQDLTRRASLSDSQSNPDVELRDLVDRIGINDLGPTPSAIPPSSSVNDSAINGGDGAVEGDNVSARHSQGPSKIRDEPDKEVSIFRPTFAKKYGKTAVTILLTGPLLILGSIGFLAFLWFANYNNPTWHAIMVHDWLTKAITICSEVIKQAINLQAGIASAMLAALALERFEVLLPSTASVAMMRSGTGSGKVYSLAKKQLKNIKSAGWKHMALPALTTILAITLALTQIITIVLVSDASLSSIPGNSRTVQTAFGFAYSTPNYTSVPQAEVLLRGTSWIRKAFLYPTFAEYSEPPFVQDGVSDTGTTLRAFLPFQIAQDRQSVHEYTGRTTVLDSRVTCQVPFLQNETVRMPTYD
jgi:hypothetical protein